MTISPLPTPLFSWRVLTSVAQHMQRSVQHGESVNRLTGPSRSFAPRVIRTSCFRESGAVQHRQHGGAA